MINHLKNNLPSLYLCTSVAFLLIYTSGDKISTFNFMLIPLYIFMIMNGQGDIFTLNINPIFTVLIDVLTIMCLVYALFFLMRAGIKHKIEIVQLNKCLVCLMILLLFATWIGFNANLTAPSLITLTVFGFLTLITLTSSIALRNSKK